MSLVVHCCCFFYPFSCPPLSSITTHSLWPPFLSRQFNQFFIRSKFFSHSLPFLLRFFPPSTDSHCALSKDRSITNKRTREEKIGNEILWMTCSQQKRKTSSLSFNDIQFLRQKSSHFNLFVSYVLCLAVESALILVKINLIFLFLRLPLSPEGGWEQIKEEEEKIMKNSAET